MRRPGRHHIEEQPRREVFHPPAVKTRGNVHRHTNYGDRVQFGLVDDIPNPPGNVEPYDKAVRLVDVRTDELGSWVVDLDSRLILPPEESESSPKIRRVTARIGMGTGGVSSVFDVDVFGCARLALPCETLTVDVTAHDEGVIGEGSDSPVAVLQQVEATCQRSWANTIARFSVQMIATAEDPNKPNEGQVKVPKYACQVMLYSSDGGMAYDANTEYEFISNSIGTSDGAEQLELSGPDFRALLLTGSAGLWLPPFCDTINWSFGGMNTADPGDWLSFLLAV